MALRFSSLLFALLSCARTAAALSRVRKPDDFPGVFPSVPATLSNGDENSQEALLQRSGEGKSNATLPPVRKVLEKPEAVITGMNSNVDALLASLANVEQANADQVRKRKHKYEDKLEKQNKQNKALERENKDLSSEIRELKQLNSGLRADAEALVKRSGKLRAHLNSLMSNMSTAQEFTASMLDRANARLHNSTELSVLQELEEQDRAQSAEMDHQSRLKAISHTHDLGLLELDAQRSPKTTAQELLSQMTASLNDLAEQQNSSLASLEQSFNDMFQKGEQRHQELLDENQQLNATKEAETQLHQRLAEAVKHLAKVHKSLSAQLASIQGFLTKVGTSGAMGGGRATDESAESAAKRHRKHHAETTVDSSDTFEEGEVEEVATEVGAKPHGKHHAQKEVGGSDVPADTKAEHLVEDDAAKRRHKHVEAMARDIDAPGANTAHEASAEGVAHRHSKHDVVAIVEAEQDAPVQEETKAEKTSGAESQQVSEASQQEKKAESGGGSKSKSFMGWLTSKLR